MIKMEFCRGLQTAQIGTHSQVRPVPIIIAFASLSLNEDENILDDDESQHALRLDILVR